jgi:hypothetical protein
VVPKLNQIIAIEKGAKSTNESEVTRAYHLLQKPDVFSGLARTYTPKNEDGEELPSEAVNVIVTVPALVDAFSNSLTRLFDITATKVFANTKAVADVVVDDTVILEKVPVEYLLFLEKRLADIMTFLGKVPILDPAYNWSWDDSANAYKADPVKTNRTKKVMKNHVKAPATDKHPAQVETYTEDEVVGVWEKVMFSGAVPVTKVNEWKERVLKLQAAVKMAREEANSIEVAEKKIGKDVFSYVFSTNGHSANGHE